MKKLDLPMWIALAAGVGAAMGVALHDTATGFAVGIAVAFAAVVTKARKDGKK